MLNTVQAMNMQTRKLRVNGDEVETDAEGYLHAIFPRGGPQKQGNRLTGLLRTKGEH